MANEYLGECHALCFIENRKGISQIYPKIQEFVQLIHFLVELRYWNSFASILLQRSYMEKCHFTLNKRYANKIDHNSASNGYF